MRLDDISFDWREVVKESTAQKLLPIIERLLYKKGLEIYHSRDDYLNYEIFIAPIGKVEDIIIYLNTKSSREVSLFYRTLLASLTLPTFEVSNEK